MAEATAVCEEADGAAEEAAAAEAAGARTDSILQRNKKSDISQNSVDLNIFNCAV
jgi:hypothetical protein